MDALCWYGKEDVRVEDVPEPTILNPRDAIVRITTTAICGSDLHMYDGYIAGLKPGDILGHEFMGEIVDVGPGVKNLAVGDRVVVPFGIYCGRCESCRRGLWAMCDNSNENASVVEAAYGFSGAALFGYSHLYGGYAGGQAQFARVPFADVGPVKVPDGLRDEQVIFLTDILPTGYQAAEQCGIRPGDVVAIWGCGPVGQFAIQSAYLLGADRVIAIDRVPERLAMARDVSHAETIDYSEVEDVVEALKQLTGGRGPDHCIDAVGMESHGTDVMAMLDKVKQTTRIQLDRANVLRQAIQACGKGGTVSVPGVYTGYIGLFPMGAVFGKSLTIRGGQTHMLRYMKPLMDRIMSGDLDPTKIISHRLPLREAPHAYRIFRDKQDHCTKVVLTPS
ncbi:MAG TPA: zinc-dependent alcohol dehydrogenase [Gemmatimonadaceae bacterium]|nr:zinc-dependent alcohol dehydrogenase [Gemmatimonadaceae bacterium]